MTESEIVLKPYTRAFLDAVAAAGELPLESMPVPASRAIMNEGMRKFGGPGEPVARVESHVAPGAGGDIPLRLYAPASAGPLGVVLFYHGGGFVIGGLDEYDATARRLANAASAIVVAVDYRLAPEAPFPAALDDAYAALLWVAEHARALGGDPAKLAVTGDSAGGYLAASVAQVARDRNGPKLAFQALVYPKTDTRERYASYDRYGEGLYLTWKLMQWFESKWFADASARQAPYAAPLREKLEGLPPAAIVLAECDPLHDEGIAYAEALKAAGVPVTLHVYPGIIHGFYGLAPIFPEATAATTLLGSAIAAAFLT